VDPERAQGGDELVGGLPGDVGEHEVAGRGDRGTGQDGEVRRPRIVLEELTHLAGAVGRHGDPQLQQHGCVLSRW
jgi:hypothetical protein